MPQESIRINKILKEFNIGMGTLIDFLKSKKIEIEASPSAKIDESVYAMVEKEFGKDLLLKEQSKKVAIKVKEITEQTDSKGKDEEELPEKEIFIKTTIVEPPAPKIVGKIDLDAHKKVAKKEPEKEIKETPVIKKVEIQKDLSDNISEEKKREPEVIEIPTKPEPVQPPQNKIEKPVATEVKEVATEVKKEESPVIDQPVIKKVEQKTEPKTEPKPEPVTEIKKEEPKSEQIKPVTVKKETPKPEVTKPKEAVVKATKVVTKEEPKKESSEEIVEQPPVIEHIETTFEKLSGPEIVGTIDLSQFESKKSSSDKKNYQHGNKGKRERIKKGGKEKVDLTKELGTNKVNKANKPFKDKDTKEKERDKRDVKGKRKDKFKPVKVEIAEDEVQKQIKETYARMVESKGKTKGSKHRRDKRESVSQKMQEAEEMQEIANSVLKVTEFVTVHDLSMLMSVPVTKVIEACMNLGLMVSINQRLDAEAMVLVAEEFGFSVEFVTADIQDAINEEVDSEEDLVPRPPIVTVMGHVDHGKTSLLDYIRKANVIAGEAGGITQHIGAYNVKLADGQRITFLDTPGHEAFTAMRARGAKVTDLAIIIIAADDAVMPQTKEAINHAQAAGVPMIFAINKVDKPSANPEKIKEQLANMNLLVEDWGGKHQCQEISAKQGLNVEKLLEKVLLEAELLDLKANPDKNAVGTVIESSLDKGRGYLATILVQAGTLKIGDIIISGSYSGRIRAMFNERGQKITVAGPSTPVSILGLNGAPAAGEIFNVMNDEKEARELANKREQLIRIQGIKTHKHITLEEIGRRIAVGNFQELNIIVKGDVDGSIEALSDSLIKLSNEEIHVNVIHKAVGAISESDVLLAAASNAIIIGFQVRPSANSRKLAEKEEIEIRLYSVIYDAINEVKSGIEGMLAPEKKEEITSTVEVRETFKISKVGTIAGCMVKEGKVTRNSKIRVIRDGIVIYTGELGSLKRFKDDVKEVLAGYECGLNVENFNDIKSGDIIESYTIVEIKRKLS